MVPNHSAFVLLIQLCINWLDSLTVRKHKLRTESNGSFPFYLLFVFRISFPFLVADGVNRIFI